MNTYQYADGNGNRYIIAPTSVHYIPVTPKESSSGTYSGGEPLEVMLPESYYATICTVLDKVLTDESQHVIDRVMGSGKLIQNSGTGSHAVILRPGSLAQQEVEEILAMALSAKL